MLETTEFVTDQAVKPRHILVTCLIPVLMAVLLSCSGKPYPESDDELFQALDGATSKWLNLYLNGEVARQDQLREKIEHLARDNRFRVLSAINKNNLNHRMVAAKTLPFLYIDEKVLKAMSQVLSDADQKVRENAASALLIMDPSWNKYGDELQTIRKKIEKMTESKSIREREAAYLAISGLVSTREPRGFMDELLQGLRSDSAKIRNQSVRAFQVINEQKTLKPLLEHTLHDPSEKVRLNTVLALMALDDRRAIPELIKRLREEKTENPEITRAVVKLLKRLTGLQENQTPSEWIKWYETQKKENGDTPSEDSTGKTNKPDQAPSDNQSGNKNSGSETDPSNDRNE